MWLNELSKRLLGWSTTGRPPAPRRRGARLRLERLEDRLTPSAFNAATVSDLIADINAANQQGGSNTITLTAPTTPPYILTAVDNTTDGATGLPVIAANDNLTILGIIGNGDIIERSSASGTPAFRLFDVAGKASLTLGNLTLQGGLAFGSGVSAEGGGIYNQGTLDLNGVTVQNNTAQGQNGSTTAGQSASGGGIYSGGALTLEAGTSLQNNQAVGGKGGTFIGRPFPHGFPGGNGLGGGLYAAGGSATLTSDTVTGNAANGGHGGAGRPAGSSGLGEGGGLYIAPAASVSVDASTLANLINNTASTSYPNIYGFTTDTVVLVVNSLADNTADTSHLTLRDAITLVNNAGNPNSLGQPSMPAGWAAQISGTFSGQATIEFDPSLSGGAITLGGTELPTIVWKLTITGLGAGTLAISGNGQSTVFSISSAPVSISGLTIEGGSATFGGGLFSNGNTNLTISDSTFSLNSATYGGAVYTRDGTVTLKNDTFSDNTASQWSGAIDNWANGTVYVSGCTFTGNSASDGGAIGNEWGTVSVTRSVFQANTTSGGGGAIANDGTITVDNSTLSGNSSGTGGAVDTEYSYYRYGNPTTRITKSTFANNQAKSGGAIGGTIGATAVSDTTIFGNSASGSGGGLACNHVNIISSTITGNSAPDGGGIDASSGPLTLQNTIVSNNSATTSGPDIYGSITTDNGYNLLGTAPITGASGPHDLFNDNPDLSALGNYGGPTQTMPPFAGSPALGTGNNTGGPSTDQRGFARRTGIGGDIGAVEVTVLKISPGTLAPATVGTSYTQTITASGGTGPYSFIVSSGALPPGLTLSSAGVLSGTPTAAGAFHFRIKATDSSSSPGPYIGYRYYTLTVSAAAVRVPFAAIIVAPTAPEAPQAEGGTAHVAAKLTEGSTPKTRWTTTPRAAPKPRSAPLHLEYWSPGSRRAL